MIRTEENNIFYTDPFYITIPGGITIIRVNRQAVITLKPAVAATDNINSTESAYIHNKTFFL